MGIEIYSAHKSQSLPCSGFWRLRKTIASLCPDDMNEHYCDFMDNFRDIIGDEESLAAYNAETDALYQKYRKQYGKVFDFLYASDCDARLTYGTAKQLLNVIGDYQDDKIRIRWMGRQGYAVQRFCRNPERCHREQEKVGMALTAKPPPFDSG